MFAYLVKSSATDNDWNQRIVCLVPHFIIEPDKQILHLVTDDFAGFADIIVADDDEKILVRVGPYSVIHGQVLTSGQMTVNEFIAAHTTANEVDNVNNCEQLHRPHSWFRNLLGAVIGG